MSNNQKLLSILICSIIERTSMLQKLLANLDSQITELQSSSVEILVSVDNRSRSIGKKRNDLIQQSQGKFVTFIDDDDRVSEDYVQCLLKHIEQNNNADVIVFRALYHNEETSEKYEVYYDKRLYHTFYPQNGVYNRKPNHLMCFSRRISLDVKFEDCSFGEDTSWAEKVEKYIHRQVAIPKILYYYDYNPLTSTSRQNIPGKVKTNEGLRVVYGNASHSFKDVTIYFKNNFVRNQSYYIPQGTKFEMFFGDPLPGMAKKLNIRFKDEYLIEITDSDILDHGYYCSNIEHKEYLPIETFAVQSLVQSLVQSNIPLVRQLKIGSSKLLSSKVPGVWNPLQTLRASNSVKRIVEIGTFQGGTTLLLSHIFKNVDIHTFDIRKSKLESTLKQSTLEQSTLEQSTLEQSTIEHITMYNMDVFEDSTIDIIRKLLEKDGQTILLCDGGNKIQEVEQFSKYLKKHDILLVHDYIENSKTFHETFMGKIWNWHEVSLKDIDMVKHQLEPYMKTEFESYVIGAFKKN